MITSSINCFTSFFAGFAVFAVLGHMATIQGKEVKDVARNGEFLFLSTVIVRLKDLSWCVMNQTVPKTVSHVINFEENPFRCRFCNYCPIQTLQHDSSLIFQQFDCPGI